jgi:hypothetical protein
VYRTNWWGLRVIRATSVSLAWVADTWATPVGVISYPQIRALTKIARPVLSDCWTRTFPASRAQGKIENTASTGRDPCLRPPYKAPGPRYSSSRLAQRPPPLLRDTRGGRRWWSLPKTLAPRADHNRHPREPLGRLDINPVAAIPSPMPCELEPRWDLLHS